ncbi:MULTISPECIES: NAD(P)H-binding protein [unclassified Rhizobium]|uniref:SDR family oxidoreductase n=1 Tax=unclassified Rhizobium TaxID=2613769 RepID=UPI0028891E07|nr:MULTISPECIES: NAD(P)H-binding protein [unclassified Rhizobium]
MSIVIHGASGAQGGPIFDLLLAKGSKVLAAVRDQSKMGSKPSIVVDNASVESMVAAYTGADAVFFHLPNTSESARLTYALNFLEAIKTGTPQRVVVSTSGAIIDQKGSPVQVSDDSAIGTLVNGLSQSGTSHAIVAPRIYLENLLSPTVINRVKEAGVLLYPLRVDYAASWSSHLDVADVAERLLLDHSLSGIVGVGQLPGLKGADLAKAFALRFGLSVEFVSQTPEDLRKSLAPYLGLAAANVAAFYQKLLAVDANVIAEETSAQRLLGMTPRTAVEWLSAIPA